jgi:glycosyltransferase involved in cell wall biosynthesis
MKVGIDTRSLKRGPAGVATYVRHLLDYLDCLDGIDYARPSNNFLWNQWWGAACRWTRGWRVFHAPGYTGPLVGGVRLVLSVHDISYLVNRAWYPYRFGALRRTYYRASLRRAAAILVPSRFTRDEIVSRHPELAARIRLIPLGVGEEFQPDPAAAAAARRELGLPERFLLHVGDIHPRRNIDLIHRAAVDTGLPLVLVGRCLVGGTPADSVRYEGVSVDRLRGVYNAAEALVYASAYEGFGLPLLEAMACGLPVVAVRRASIPEVCGEAARLVDPEGTDLSAAVKEVLDDRDAWQRKGLSRAAQFSWAETARRTGEVYREVED